MPTSKTLIMLIHTLKSKLGLSDDEYRAVLAGYGVESSAEMDQSQKQDLVEALTRRAVKAGVWKDRRKRSTREGVDGHSRPGNMASPKQINYIEALWRAASRATDDETRRRALDSFIHHRFNRGGLLMVEKSLVKKVIKAIETMIENPPKEDNHAV